MGRLSAEDEEREWRGSADSVSDSTAFASDGRKPRETLDQIVLEDTTLEEAIDSGAVKIDESQAKLDEILSYPESFEFWFDVVTP